MDNKEFKRIDTLKGINYKDDNIIVPILLDYRHESIVCGKLVHFAFTDKFAMHHESFKNSTKKRPKRFIGFLALGVSIVSSIWAGVSINDLSQRVSKVNKKGIA